MSRISVYQNFYLKFQVHFGFQARLVTTLVLLVVQSSGTLKIIVTFCTL